MRPLNAQEILAALDRREVRYILIGGLAAVLHGSPIPTLDLDVCPARDGDNLEHLAAALRELGARIRTADAPEGLAFACDAQFLARIQILNLTTLFGDLDLSFTPSGTAGFEDLDRQAVLMSIGSLQVRVSALEDVIRSKEAANRPRDQRALPALKQLLAEIKARAARDKPGDPSAS